MTIPRADDLHVRLTVDDARTAQAAGVQFARALVGADADDFALALAEQSGLIERAITRGGYSTEQATLAAGHFVAAAQDEWQRIGASTNGTAGHA